MEVIIERVAGLDIHKKSITACVRTPDDQGARAEQVRTFSAFLDGLEALRAWLADERVTHVAMEATSSYWLPLWHVLEEGEVFDTTDVDVALTVPTDYRGVLETTRGIPYGRQISVERLCRMTPGLDADSDEDQNTAREALDANPTPLFVPDHRVRDGPSAAPPAVEQRLRTLEGL